jgi:hypothetical protein
LGQEQQNKFQMLKEDVVAAQVLSYADNSKHFELHLDAPNLGLAAVLYQDVNAVDKVIAYAVA